MSKKETLSQTPPPWLALLHAKQPFHQLSCSENSEEKLLVIGERKLLLVCTVINIYAH